MNKKCDIYFNVKTDEFLILEYLLNDCCLYLEFNYEFIRYSYISNSFNFKFETTIAISPYFLIKIHEIKDVLL